MKTLFLGLVIGISLVAQAPLPSPQQTVGIPSSGPGSGTVTSVVIAGTTNQINVTGTCTITTTGTCTLALPAGLVLPGTVNGLTITTTTGTITIASAKVLTVNNSFTLAGTDGVTLTFPTTSATIARTDAGQTFTGNQTMTALLQSGSTAPTQSQADNSTKVATTAYVDAGLAHIPVAVLRGNCSASALSSGTNAVGLDFLGGAVGNGACAQAAQSIYGSIISTACTMSNLSIHSSVAGAGASDGIFTVQKNASSTALTCTVGTGTTCTDTTHSFSAAVGDLIWILATTTSTNLAGLAAVMECR